MKHLSRRLFLEKLGVTVSTTVIAASLPSYAKKAMADSERSLINGSNRTLASAVNPFLKLRNHLLHSLSF